MRCHRCHTRVDLATGERIAFRDECTHCGADLHACQNCTHHDPSAYNECREPSAERVRDRDRANRCDWFGPGDASGESDGQANALSDLDALFRK